MMSGQHKGWSSLTSRSRRSGRRCRIHFESMNYSSSQEEVETEDDCCEATDPVTLKEPLTGVYDAATHDEESCHLLQTEDDSESSDSEHGKNSSASSIGRSSSSNGGTISDGEGNEDQRHSHVRKSSSGNYWNMTAEQDKYYTEQFLNLQPDVGGLVNGAVAKGFFEKSRLPHLELRDIWQLADITQDGFLDITEFKMAMHLVILRRHALPIPSHFYNLQTPEFYMTQTNSNQSFKVGSKVLMNNSHISSSLDYAPTTVAGPSQPPSLVASGSKTDCSKPHQPHHQKRPSKEWTTFENEPINFSSTCDTSGLVAPVPVRLKTPEDKLIMSTVSGSASASKAQQLQLKAIQRPKLSGQHPKISTGTIAPPPPPRRKTHVRSSSLDLNRLIVSAEAQSQSSHVVGRSDIPPRSFLSPCHQGGAFSVYRKPQPPKTATIHEPPNIPTSHLLPATSNSMTNTDMHLQQDVSDLRNENSTLSRISGHLLEQLSALQTRKQSVSYKIHELHANYS